MSNYNELKKYSLEVYEKFSYFLEKFNKEQKEGFFELPINEEDKRKLVNKAEKIKNDKFRLMVLGEAKSGKSTFINTYLGLEDLLPTDSLQCTSSIIEIKNSEKLKLTAIYADNTEKIYTDKKEIKEVLLKNGSLIEINDKYKDIPTVRINNDIFLVKKGEKVTSREINDFVENLKDEKKLSMTDEEYKKLIEEYILKYQNNWKKIIKKMVIEYPFVSESIKDIEIIDSPGLNAVGGLEEITREYTKKADAIMFLQSSEAPVENKLLKSLIGNYSTNRNTSFLVMTKAGKLSNSNLEKNFKEIYKYYENSIEEKQIIYIDSVFQNYSLLIEKKYKNFEELENYVNDNENSIDPAVTNIIYKNRNIEKIINELRDKSNFRELEKVLNLFGRKAHYFSLDSFLGEISNFLYKINSKISQEISIYDLKEPKYFEEKINELLEDIRIIKVKMNDIIVNKALEYQEELKKEVEKKLSNIKERFKQVETFEEMENIFFNEVENFKFFQQDFINDKILDLNTKIIKLEENDVEFNYLEPNITEDELKIIDSIAKKNATKVEFIKEGVTFKKTREKISYSRDEHLNILRKNILGRFEEEIVDTIKVYMTEYMNKTIDKYEEKLNKNLKNRNDELNNTLKYKEENEKKAQIKERLCGFKKNFENCNNEAENYLRKIKEILK